MATLSQGARSMKKTKDMEIDFTGANGFDIFNQGKKDKYDWN